MNDKFIKYKKELEKKALHKSMPLKHILLKKEDCPQIPADEFIDDLNDLDSYCEWLAKQ